MTPTPLSTSARVCRETCTALALTATTTTTSSSSSTTTTTAALPLPPPTAAPTPPPSPPVLFLAASSSLSLPCSYIWDVPHFSTYDKVVNRYGGAIAMRLAQGKIKKKYNIDDERAALDAVVVEWTDVRGCAALCCAVLPAPQRESV